VHDLVIRSGRVVDGTGAPAFEADVAVDGDRIRKVGYVPERGRRELDASGKLVTPGFVDIHTHLDAQLAWDPIASSSCWHGVTSVVIGNCGVTFAPVKRADHAWLAEMMESVEDIPARSILDGLPWDWESYGEFLAWLGRTPKGVNVGGLVGHGAVRAALDAFFVLNGEGGRARYDCRAEDGLVAIAARRGVSPAEAFVALALETEGRLLLSLPFLNQDAEAIAGMLAEPVVLVGLADAGAHVGLTMDASAPTWLLCHWVRDRGVLSLEDAVRRLTSDTAATFGIEERGVLRAGAFADLNVIDLAALALPVPEFVHDFPHGAGRFRQGASGYDATLVNGEVFMEHGRHTGALAGRLLRGRSAPA
jgi:N-acyl-D-aspartate/D-glutamate deacylase